MTNLLTVEAAAEILSVHTRTVRRYIKEQKLKAHKVGGQWRIAAEELKEFMGLDSLADMANRPVPNPEQTTYETAGKEKVLVSAVVDVNVASREEALRLSSSIMAAMNSGHRTEKARCDYLFYEEEGRARFMLWGPPSFMRTMMNMFDVLSNED